MKSTALLLLLCTTPPALAQSVIAGTAMPHVATCRDFAAEADGNWTALAPITIENEGVSSAVGQGGKISPGQLYSNDDLGGWLDRHCAPARVQPDDP